MNISRQGSEHYLRGSNNQDFYYDSEKVKLVLDGCSESMYSEIGTRLFVQAFSKLPDNGNLDLFEENVKTVFNQLITAFQCFYTNDKELEDFILDNFLFTIIACFETEEAFVVKLFGDGYVITVNQEDIVSYLKHFYGKRPPYYSYKYCKLLEDNFCMDYEFKTFSFSKKEFKKVGIATDGIVPIVRGDLKTNFDELITSPLNTEYSAEGIILANRQLFKDDVTIVM